MSELKLERLSFLITLFIISVIVTIYIGNVEIKLNQSNDQIKNLTIEINSLKIENENSKSIIIEKQKEIDRLKPITISRGGSRNLRIMNVSAYTASADECGNSLGICADGTKVQQWCTVAMGKNIPFGTRIYIPYFKDYPNNGIFVKHDTGGAIGVNNVDVYMVTKTEASSFGRRNLEVYILGKE